MKEAGYQQNEFCLHPDDFPLFEPFTGGVPQDAMHTLYCSGGLASSELAELIHDCVHKKVFTLKALNERITKYRE